MKDKLWTRQIINYCLYTSAGVIYGLFGTNGAGTYGILLIPIILFTILIFLYNLSFTYFGQSIFKKQQLLAYLTPQLLGLVILTIFFLKDSYLIDYDFDKILWGFLFLTTILNIWTYFILRPVKKLESKNQRRHHDD